MATLGFVARALVWITALFGALRLRWVQEHLLVPSATLQQGIACALTGAPQDAVVVDQSCTGSDAMALCLGAILAFPVGWRRRLTGAAVGLVFVLAINTARIGSLSLVVSDRELFRLLHVYVWPAAIVLAAAAYVYWWMGRSVAAAAAGGQPPAPATPAPAGGRREAGLARFLLVAAPLVGLYYLLHARWLASETLDRVAWAVARTAGFLMEVAGMQVAVTDQVVRTDHGSWIITPECATTPLIPIYLAGVLAHRLPVPRRLLALLAVVPLFFTLAVCRLLVLALPPAVVGSPTDAVHGFYQVLAGVGLVALAARHGSRSAAWGRRLAGGVAAGLAAGSLAALFNPLARAVWPRLAGALHLGHGVLDEQGALELLPAFQIGLLAALWQAGGRRWRARPLIGRLTVLGVSQLAAVVGAGELATHLSVPPPIALIRAWALLVPALLAWRWSDGTRLAGQETGPAAAARQRGFWDRVGAEFPDLGGAASTAQYLAGEQRLLELGLGDLESTRLLKTDLWDEARNTRILQWAAERGARVHGIDLSTATLLRARAEFRRRRLELGAVVADVRALPFRDAAFDAAYSMGTVEHFDETRQAVGEIARSLRPGGRLVLGVPNRHDPFLRPLLVAILYRLGLYGYGFEKSYSRRQLRLLVENAGLTHRADGGLLFIPGWLRMVDLACWTWARPLSRLTALAVRPFAWLEKRFPALRRHGYLIASIASKPATGEPPTDRSR